MEVPRILCKTQDEDNCHFSVAFTHMSIVSSSLPFELRIDKVDLNAFEDSKLLSDPTQIHYVSNVLIKEFKKLSEFYDKGMEVCLDYYETWITESCDN